MASLVLGVAGAAVGFAVGGPTGAQIGFSVGSALGASLTKMPDIQGPRLSDLKVQSSTYGKPIPIYYGTSRGSGEIMWSSDLIETENEEDAGGKGGPSQSVISYTYSVNCAVAVCAGEITGIRKIWANNNLIYDQSEGNLGPTGQSGNIRVYTGSESQVADSLLEAYLGAGNVPAHRGLAYVVFENLQLEKYGNRIPNFSFEVVSNGTPQSLEPIRVSEMPRVSMTHPFIDGLLITVTDENGSGAPAVMHVIDLYSQTERIFNIGDIPATYCQFELEYVNFFEPITGVALNEIWVSYDTMYLGYSNIVAVAFDAATLEFTRNIDVGSGGFSFHGNMHFDKRYRKVMFATNNSTIADGFNFLDPATLVWESTKAVPDMLNWFLGIGISGKNSIALVGYDAEVCIFENGNIKNVIQGGTPSILDGYLRLAYDSSRERYAWYDRNVSGKMVFKTVDDNFTGEVKEFSPLTTLIPEFAFYTWQYFPIADKYFYTDRYNLYKLNADTFETEQKWELTSHPNSLFDPREITGTPEYIALSMITPPQEGVKILPITDRLASNTVTLASIVTDICGRVDLAPSDIDVTGLTDEVEGYTIAQQMTARAAIDGLQAAFYFDAVESD